MDIEVVRVYKDPGRRLTEHRALVDRLWPRGITKAALDLDEWATDVAPSTELRRWYGHEPARFDDFAHRYQEELTREPGSTALERLRSIANLRGVVLLTATRDVERSGAIVLRDLMITGGPA